MEKLILLCDFCNKEAEQVRSLKVYETPLLLNEYKNNTRKQIKTSRLTPSSKFVVKHICFKCLSESGILTEEELKHFENNVGVEKNEENN